VKADGQTLYIGIFLQFFNYRTPKNTNTNSKRAVQEWRHILVCLLKMMMTMHPTSGPHDCQMLQKVIVLKMEIWLNPSSPPPPKT